MVQVAIFRKKRKEVPHNFFIAEPHSFDILPVFSNYSSQNTEILFQLIGWCLYAIPQSAQIVLF
jgi:hypothetical protein